MHTLCSTTIRLGLLLAFAFGLDLASAAPGSLLFHDSFESTLTLDHASAAQPTGGTTIKPGGRCFGPVTLGPGKDGQGAKFDGVAQICYEPATHLIDPRGGELAVWVQLHFDPTASNERTRTVLRNQSFVSLWDKQRGYSSVTIYNAGRNTYAVCVMNATRNIVFHKNFSAVWRPGQWHHLKLTWGQELALWCDGVKKASGSFHGLFGPVPFDLAHTMLYLGTHLGYSNLESQFTLDELTIRGPSTDQITRRPRITLPLLSDRPTLDGRLDEPFWQAACRVQRFFRLPTDELATARSEFRAAYTADGLWLGLETPIEDLQPARAADKFTVFLVPEAESADALFQFIVNASGAQRQGRQIGGANSHWQCAVRSDARRWHAEVFLPFPALGLRAAPSAGTVWRGNFCVEGDLSWADVPDANNEPLYFGELVFSGKLRTVRQERLQGFAAGEALLTYSLVGDFPPIISVAGELWDSKGASLFRHSLRLRDTKSIDLRPPILSAGQYLMSVEAIDETGQVVLREAYRFRTTKTFDISVSKFPYAGYAQFKADAKGVREPVRQVRCAVAGPDGKVVGEQALSVAPSGMAEGRFPIHNLVTGLYTVTATALAPNGKTLDSAKRSFEVFPRPDWWKNNLGLDHSVPPPYKPVRVTERGLAVWGREYTFDAAVFPKQIRNQGMAMFVAPPAFRLHANGQAVDLADLRVVRKDCFPDAVTLSATQNMPGLVVSIQSRLEFDGFLRCDLTLTPTAGPVTLAELVMELPVSRAIGRFLMTSSGGSSEIRPLTLETASAFLPYVWLGSDDMGLAWFADNDRFWSVDPKRAIVAIPGADKVVLRVNIVSKPLRLVGPATYSLGIMPSPIRPIPVNDPYAFPSYNATEKVTFSEFVTYPIPDALRRGSGTLEFWVKRSEPTAGGNTALFYIGGKKVGLRALWLTPNRPDELLLTGGERGQKAWLKAHVPITPERFTHLALTWHGDALRCYADGQLVGNGSPALAAELRAALSDEGARIQLGCVDDTSGYTGIVLDEVRVSKNSRYEGETARLAAGPFTADANTLILDHFEDRFQPDGQDAWTAGGGVPTIGGQFVADGRFGRGLKLQVAPPRPGLDALREMGVKVGTDWTWQPEMAACCGQPVLLDNSRLVPGLRQSLQEWKQHGILNLPYMAFPAISSTSGLIERYGDEWATLPISTLLWQFPGAPPNYYFLNCCQQARAYADYFAAGVPWVMDEIGYDGFYSDGLTNIAACQNEAHGCGYRDRDGGLHATYPLFATRETLKRMYRLVKARNPQGLVVNHCSFNLLLPILSFSDVVYTGEHEDYENPLTARLRFSSKPWGLYITLLGASEHVYRPLHAMAPLLSGASVWGSGIVGRNDFGRKDLALRNAYRTFGTQTAKWSPWWENEQRACRTSDPLVRVSFYCHPGKDVLLLAGNFHPDDRTPAIRLDLAQCGLAGRAIRATNALTGMPVAVSIDGQFAPLIRGKSFVLLRLD